jgi:rare lipoprotein A
VDLAAAPSGTGPQGDYPVVVGDAYTVNGTAYAPEDVLNYDQVGMLAADAAGGSRISGAHHTLPLPSYVEVTSLATGRTILARMERRGPMDGTDLIALSPGALAQLEASPGTPVRVRRVNPPEDQRALLRAGQSAPLRIDTPMSLVEVLKRKLPSPPAPAPVTLAVAASVNVSLPAPTKAPVPKAAAPKPTPTAIAKAPVAMTPRPASAVKPPKTAPAPSTNGKFSIQVAAFASSANATAAATKSGGKVTSDGKFFRVRTGPFTTRANAEASLAKVKAAGYSDARIHTSG